MTDLVAGRFALCDPIARGGSGVVWRAMDVKTGRYCAAKVMRRRDAGDLLRFAREQSVRLAHHHVLTPYSWAAEDEHVVIASELVDGGSLSTLLGDYGALAEPTVAAILDQLLDALEHVHAAGLIHRDVKPGNVLLPATGTGALRVLLADFGLAIGGRDVRLTQVGTVVGTPGYLAPELLSGGVTPAPTHDLYAAGQVAAALLAGAEPSDVGAAPDLSRVRDPVLRAVVADLTTANPLARPSSATAVRSRLRQATHDPVPRSADGDRIDVLHQLPPVPAEDQREVARVPAATRRTAALSPVPRKPARGPAATLVNTPTPRRRWGRRRAVFAAAGTFGAAAVAVPLALAISHSGDGGTSGGPGAPNSSTGRSSAPKSPTTGGQSGNGGQVAAGQACTWQQQGNGASTSAGKTVVCTRKSDGTYVWAAP
ncbi:MAG: serine/threonine protein kinase [Pseudonocardiales bacterium]|nr:MAG: serine/threonine protein kinase [Pseudonocardiales bacterium]